MNKLSKLERINLPVSCVSFLYQHFRNSGAKGLECVGLLAGRYTSDTEFEICEAIIPTHKAYNLEGGLLYSVGEEELHRINVLLYEKQLSLVSQIHTHPGRAYHSETDDAYPILATVGGLSIVVPDFAYGKFELSAWAVYRLKKDTGWTRLSTKEVSKLITIV
ncbi:MAG: Mov34/MPN/PAD-1 family protein [Bacteroidia bacterium]|jgi:proteasome lid subunit RPN8/RPN11|nr:Mov34/MPN/PAD-1 family protein [Bacteroidia bacterium]